MYRATFAVLGNLCALLGVLWMPMKVGAADNKPRDGRLDAALAVWERSAAALRSFDLVLRVDTTDLLEHPKGAKSRHDAFKPKLLPPGTKPPVITTFARHVLSKEGKRRYENLDPNDPKDDNWIDAKVFNGAEVRWLSRRGGGAGVSGAGPDKACFASYYDDYFALYRDLSDGGAMIWLLRSRHGAMIAEGRKGEVNYVVIESPPEESDYYPELELKIALDPKHGMLPAEIDSPSGGLEEKQPFWRLAIDKFHEVEPGVWAPVQATFRWGPTGKVFSVVKVAVDMDRSQWNKPVPEDFFTLAFPVGTRVKDDVRGIIYTTGKPDAGIIVQPPPASRR